MIFNIGRLGTGLCPAESDLFLIHKFHVWFHAGVAQWLDIALYKALQRIKKAVEIDHLVPVDSSVKYSSSAVDTLAIFYQVQYLWFAVEGKRVKMHHQDMGYISARVNTITNRQYTGSIPFPWGMMLCHWVIGSQNLRNCTVLTFKCRIAQEEYLLNILTLEDEDSMLPRKPMIQLPSDTLSCIRIMGSQLHHNKNLKIHSYLESQEL